MTIVMIEKNKIGLGRMTKRKVLVNWKIMKKGIFLSRIHRAGFIIFFDV